MPKWKVALQFENMIPIPSMKQKIIINIVNVTGQDSLLNTFFLIQFDQKIGIFFQEKIQVRQKYRRSYIIFGELYTEIMKSEPCLAVFCRNHKNANIIRSMQDCEHV